MQLPNLQQRVAAGSAIAELGRDVAVKMGASPVHLLHYDVHDALRFPFYRGVGLQGGTVQRSFSSERARWRRGNSLQADFGGNLAAAAAANRQLRVCLRLDRQCGGGTLRRTGGG